MEKKEVIEINNTNNQIGEKFDNKLKIKQAEEWYNKKDNINNLWKNQLILALEEKGIIVESIDNNGIVKAVIDFQKQYGLLIDGKAGKNTLKELGLDLSIYNKAKNIHKEIENEYSIDIKIQELKQEINRLKQVLMNIEFNEINNDIEKIKKDNTYIKNQNKIDFLEKRINNLEKLKK